MFTIVGTVIGAGVLGVPYVVAQSGYWTGMLVLFVIGFLMLVMFLQLGEVVLRTKGTHQLPGYAGIYLGKWGRHLMSISMIFSVYGALIAYIIAGGESLRDLFKSVFPGSSLIYSTIFFVILSAIILFDVKKLSESEVAISSLLIIAVLLIFIFSVGFIDVTNFSGFEPQKFFLPYGVVLFAFLGFVGIPEAAEVVGKKKKNLKWAIILGTVIPLLIYILFSSTIVGMMGPTTRELGTMGVDQLIGTKGLIIGNLFLLFAISTSFLALGFGLKEYYFYDNKLSNLKSWALSCLIPYLIFIFVRTRASFTEVLNFNGIIFGGAEAILVVLMAYKAKSLGKRKAEYSFPSNIILSVLLIAFIVLGMFTLIT